MPKPATLATACALAEAVIILAYASSADAGIRDRLRILHDRRRAPAERSAGRAPDTNRSGPADESHRRTSADDDADWSTIYSTSNTGQGPRPAPSTVPGGATRVRSHPPRP